MDSQQKPQQELSHEELIKLGEKWFKKFADFLFEEDQTLNDLIHRRVFYKVIDGFEYELIHIDHL